MLKARELQKVRDDIKDSDTQATKVFSALADPSRYKIFILFVKKHNVCVSDIAKILRVTPSSASQQCKYLEMSGLVEKKRDGQMTCYKIRQDNPYVKSFIRIIKNAK